MRNSTYLPRNAWQHGPVELGTSSPRGNPAELPSSDVEAPVELPTFPRSPVLPSSALNQRTTHASIDSYYEDVAPHFAPNDPQPLLSQPLSTNLNVIPSFGYDVTPGDPSLDPTIADVAEANRVANRSPTHSDTSNFTSISQRQINPKWRPPPGQMLAPPYRRGGGGGGPDLGAPSSSVYSGGGPQGRQRTWKEQDALLAANPDFSLAGIGNGRGGGVGGGPLGMIPRPEVGRARGSGGMGSLGSGHQRGVSGGGRYPDAM